ncbi:GyrI-like domain-containing protein [Salinispira pacifica]
MSVQALHPGPYSQEASTIAAMHHFAEQQGYTLHGRHREIYLSDPRRTSPEKLKTMIRLPLKRN